MEILNAARTEFSVKGYDASSLRAIARLAEVDPALVHQYFDGQAAPFAAALMERFGLRKVTSTALVLIAAGSALSTLVTQSWQLLPTRGRLIGLRTGSMALVVAALGGARRVLTRKGLATGVLTAGSGSGERSAWGPRGWASGIHANR